MITELLAGAEVPQWDRELMNELSLAVEALARLRGTTWQFDVMNDEGSVYRSIVAQSSAECSRLVECFFRSQFRLMHVGDQPVMRKLARETA